MASTTGTTTNLNDGRIQALRALVNSVSATSETERQSNGRSEPGKHIRQLSTKLGEIFADGGSIPSDGPSRSEKGELVNEEGLPIIDITEPIPPTEATSFRPTGPFDDPDILPLWALSEEEKARRKAERERVLDLLEQEERVEQERDRATARERWQADLEKRKEAAKTEMENLKRARELQKKMGRALLRNVIENRDRDEQEKARQAQELRDRELADAAKKPLKPKKSVSFVGVGDESDEESRAPKKKGMDWGDVAPGRLRAKAKSPVLTKAQVQNQPMKMKVIERVPGAQKPHVSPTNIAVVDSDDESEPESQPAEGESDNSQRLHHDSDSPATDIEAGDEEHIEWEDDDLDYARHQREVALAYYEKRATMGAEVSSAMNAHNHEGEGNEWDQPKVPLEATLASPPPKPPISRFKASRVSNFENPGPSSTLPSHSLGDFILPSSQSPGLKHAIRMGKLENDQLVGKESDDSDEDGNVREIIEMLKKGEITNIGPPTSAQATSSSAPSAQPTDVPPPRSRRKVSKFKMGLSQESLQPPSQSPQFSPSNSASHTPINLAGRSSPKVVSPSSMTPIPTPSRSPRPPAQGPSVTPRSTYLSPAIPNPNMPSMIVDSPSFSQRGKSHDSDTPSFRSMIIDPTIPVSASPQKPHDVNAGASHSSERPAVVLASEVRERNGASRLGEGVEKKKKVSRFMADRT